MPIIEIDGVGRVEVGNEFVAMPREQQDSFIGSIVSSVQAGKRSSFGGEPLAAPVGPMGSDGVSGDEIRARNAGDTRAKMALPDINKAYDFATDDGERKKMAEAYVQRERQDSPISMGVSDRVRQVAKGVPVIGGVLDEMNAGTAALFGGDYSKSLDYQRARDRTFETERPKESFGLQLGGGIAGSLPFMGGLGGVVGGGSKAAVIGKSAGVGAAIGAADSFGRGEGGLENRAKDAAVGGLLGAGIGVLAPVVAGGVSAGVNKIADTLRTNKDIAKMGLSRPSADVIDRVLSADGALGPIGARNIARGGDTAMLADAGPSASGLLDAVIQRGGPGAATATQAINERAGVAGKQVGKALDGAFGRPGESAGREMIVYGDRTNPTSLLYRKAYESPIDYSSPQGMAIEKLVKSRVPSSAIEKANNLMRVEGEQSKQILANIADDGSVTFERMPDVRQLDYITRALNDIAKRGDGKGAVGGNTAEGRAYGNLSRDIRDVLKEAVPEYKAALDRAGTEIGKFQAKEFGTTMLSPAVTRDAARREVSGMSKAEIAKTKEGIRTHIDDVVSNVRKMASDPNLDARQAVQALRDLSSKSAREKMEMVLGPDARPLFSSLDEAARAFELRAATANNSKTFARQAIKETTDEMTAPGPMGLLASGSPLKAGKSIVQGLLGSGPEKRVAAQDKIYNDIALALTSRRGADAQKMAQDLADTYIRKGEFDKAAKALGLLSAGAFSPSAYQSIPRPPTR